MRNRVWIAVAVALALAAALLVAYWVALNELTARVQAALGPSSQIGELRVSLRAVEIIGLKVRAPQGWPERDALGATRVTIVPDLASLVTGKVRIARIRVDGAVLSVVREANGKFRALPSLTERGKAGDARTTEKAASGAPAVLIHALEFHDATLNFFDAAIARPAHAIRFGKVEARLTELQLPGLGAKSRIELSAGQVGARGGQVEAKGDLVLGSKEGQLAVSARGVELALVEPYLLRAAETGIERGSFDLNINATMAANRISAPGKVVLNGLELKPAGGFGATFMGMPRDAVVNALRNSDGRIDVPFTIEGRLDDPALSLDKVFKARLAIATAATLGISVQGLLDQIREKTGAGEKIDTIVDAVKNIFRK